MIISNFQCDSSKIKWFLIIQLQNMQLKYNTMKYIYPLIRVKMINLILSLKILKLVLDVKIIYFINKNINTCYLE